MSDILVSSADGITTLAFNRPDKKNAITAAMYAALADALEAADKDAAIRAVLITGTPGCFTAGNDLQDFLANPPRGNDSPVARFLRAISTARKPLVAAVTGVAVGVGTTMLLHCDLVYAAKSARLSLPFVNLALVPEAASSLLLPRTIGNRRAAELLLMGEPIEAEKAAAWGLINAAVDDDALAETALNAARKLAAKAPQALALSKQLMKASPEEIAAQMQAEMVHFSAQLQSAEAREAMTAFFEKRPPKFG
ncbi:enoyl-CoA hydratase [Ferrovibrio sp.]|uniref:enoyl-CoA hydratase n=1 Tax=Ferrovibrio sp. TaxID=1917215 RepID=UPI0025C26161|nr:enoyl-CoA hydratase [Ferrovibrio sp.]MBX3455840.1 enoyl-CoA hydratase [Ferrovibrio sp.]